MIENWFPTLIYYHDNIENPEIISKEIKFVENQVEKLFSHNTWQDNVQSTFKNIHNIILEYKLINLNIFLHTHVINYMTELNIKPVHFYLRDSWLNKIEKYGYQDRHIHNFETISGCYYYEDSGYEEEGIQFFISNKFGKENIVNHPLCVNRLILFPGLLEHSVKYKKTDGVRKSLSFNFKIEYM